MRKDRDKIRINERKIIMTAGVIAIIQSSMLLLFFIYFLLTDTRVMIRGNDTKILFFLIILLLASALNGLVVFRTKDQVIKTYMENDDLMLSFGEPEELNNSLRMQRHDFKNSLQVICSLIELKEYDETAAFIKEAFLDIQKLSRFLKTSNPAINALLQAKVYDLENCGILVSIDIKTRANKLGINARNTVECLGT